MRNMQNIPDKDLDHLFKQAAEMVEVKYNPQAWEKMEKKLDAKGGTLQRIIYGLGALLLMGALFYQVSVEQSVNGAASVKQTPEKTVTGGGLSALPVEIKPEVKTGEPERQPASADHPARIPGTARQTPVAEDQNGLALPPTDQTVKQVYTPVAVSGSESGRFSGSPALSPALPAVPDISSLDAPGGIIAGTAGDGQMRRFRPHFSVAFSVSPDFSGVGLSSFSKIGTNFGVFLQYHFSRRFSVSAGAIRSVKAYEVKEGFNPYKGYWDQYPKPDLVDGGCTVYDMPVNIRYNILAKDKYNLFLSTGVSTYLMKQEEYRFIYANSYDTYYEVENENKHILGVLNVSAGYERHLGRKWSLQAEPFLKLPLDEIGVGNLKLLSAGAFISLNYHFLK